MTRDAKFVQSEPSMLFLRRPDIRYGNDRAVLNVTQTLMRARPRWSTVKITDCTIEMRNTGCVEFRNGERYFRDLRENLM